MEPFGRYWLLERIGYGGMAEVFLAAPRDEPDAEHVVVKRILPNLRDRAEIVEMFRDELRISSLLHHRNIVRVRDFDESGGVPYIVLEYVEGLPLSRLLRRIGERTLPVTLACWLVAEACAGIAYAHGRTLTYSSQPLGIVHRDVSPDNILLSVAGEVKLTDFGVAQTDMRLIQAGPSEVKGKYGYMAPEQFRSGTAVDYRADIFSAGAVLYEITTGSPVFGTYNPVEVMGAIMDNRYRPADELVADYPAWLASIVSRALRWDPTDRYQDADEMRRDLLHGIGAGADLAAELADLVARHGSEASRSPTEELAASGADTVVDPPAEPRLDDEGEPVTQTLRRAADTEPPRS